MATKLSPVGSQFQVNQSLVPGGSNGIDFPQDLPDIAPLSDGRFVVVYQSEFSASGFDVDIHAHVVSANGTLSGGTIAVANPGGVQLAPAVAARGDGGFTTVWQDFGTTTGSLDPSPNIYYAVTNSAGSNTVDRTLLMDAGSFALSNPDIATMPDGRQIVVVQTDTRLISNGFDIGFDVLDADGTTQLFPGGVVFSADARQGDQVDPHVAGRPNRALLVYADSNGESNANEF